MDRPPKNFTTTELPGTYTLDSAENVEEYLKGLGVGLVLRKVKAVARPNCCITHQSDTNQWSILTESVFNSKEVTFKPLEKFQDETFDCRKCETSVEVSENNMVMNCHQKCEEGPDVESTITKTDIGLIWAMKSGEFQCELKFRHGVHLHPMQNNISPRE